MFILAKRSSMVNNLTDNQTGAKIGTVCACPIYICNDNCSQSTSYQEIIRILNHCLSLRNLWWL